MAVIILLLGFMFSVVINDWRPLGISVVMAGVVTWYTEQFLHDHIHELTHKDGDNE